MNAAALNELQQSEQISKKALYVAPIELAYRGRGRFWMIFGAVMVFCAGFIGHQVYLQLDTSSKILPVTSDIPTTVVLPQAPASQIVKTERDAVSNTDLKASSKVSGSENDVVSVGPSQAPSQSLRKPELISTDGSLIAAESVPQVSFPANEPQLLIKMQLALLQRNAVAALERDRLLTPAHDNAVFYFQSMLALEKDNVAATEGLQTVASRYIQFYERLLSRGDERGAAKMLAHAEQVSPGSTVLLAKPEAEQSVRVLSHQAPKVDASPSAVIAQSSVTLSAASQKAQLMNQVKTLAQRGQHAAIVTLLEREISAGNTDVAMQIALHSAYLAIGNVENAQRLSQRADLPGHVSSLMRAQQSIVEKEFLAAIVELEAAPPAPVENPDYFTLLAGLYYETGRHQDSQYMYRELLKQDASNGRWWLGYAVTSDALNHSDALMAYQSALRYLAKSDAARQYAQERIGQLSGKQGFN